MVLSGSRRFAVVLVGSRWLSMFLSGFVGSHRFSVVLSGCRRFSVVLNVY